MEIRKCKRVLYTVITDGYDHLFPPMVDQPGWDLICFTDDDTLRSDFWQLRPLPFLPELEGLTGDAVRAARLVKILPHRFLQDYEYSVYIDANRVLDDSLDDYIERYGGDLLCLQGAAADAYAAAEMLLDAGKKQDPKEIAPRLPLPEKEKRLLKEQVKRWKKAHLPEDGGYPGTAVLGRRHNDEKVTRVMEVWAKEVLQGCSADEVALPYACHVQDTGWTQGLSMVAKPGDVMCEAEELAVQVPHARLILGDEPPEKIEYEDNPPPPGGEYGGWPYLLTIGVPVSNQIGTIRRCLEGLQPLMEAVPSELLVVDTGSTDGTVEVCREFGARVVEFPWINNMSAARNCGIRNALGLWYMSIDDDEWFEDVSALIEFFVNEHYTQAKMAIYTQRNYNTDGKSYSDYPALRMGERTRQLHFEGRIHDHLTNRDDALQRVVALEAYSNHFGFSFEREAEKELKSIRNISILKLDFAQYPDETRHGLQMLNEYAILKRPRDAYRAAYYSLSQGRQLDPKTELALGRIPAYLLKTLNEAHVWRQGLRFFKKHIDMENVSVYIKCHLAAVLAGLYSGNKQHLKSNAMVQDYYRWRKQYLALSDGKKAALAGELNIDPTKKEVYNNVRRMELMNDIELGKHTAAEKLLQSQDLVKDFVHDSTFKDHLLNTLWAKKNWRLQVALLLALQESDNELAAEFLLAKINQCAEGGDLATLKPYLEPVYKVWPGYAHVMWLREAKPGQAGLEEHYAAAVDFVNEMRLDAGRELRMSLLGEAFRLGLDVVPAVEGADMQTVEYMMAALKEPTQRALALYKALEKWQMTVEGDMPEAVWYLAMRSGEMVLNAAKKGRGEERYMDLFENYVLRRMAWGETLYRPEVLEGMGSPWLELTYQAVVSARQALEGFEKEDFVGALKALKTTVEKAPELKEAVEVISERVGERFEERRDAQALRNKEFEMLLQNIKPKIKQLLAAGMKQEVVGLIAQLEKLVPGDAELDELKRQAGMLPPN